MTMNRLLLNKMATWLGAVALAAVVALAPYAQAQDPAPQDSQNAQAAASAQANGQRADGQIEMDVVHALDASQALKNDLITAATIQSEVTLSGTVSSDASKQLAGSIAGQVAGVTKVNNNLTVGNPQDAQYSAPPPQDAQDATGAVQGAPAQANNQPYGQQAPQADPSYGAQAPAPPAQQGQGQIEAQGPYPTPPPRPQYGSPYPPQQYPQQGQYPQQPQYPQQYPQQGQYPQQYPQQGQQPQYPAQQTPAYQYARDPVTIPQGTLLQLRTSEPVDSKRATDGSPVQFTVIQDVTMGGALAIPRGATVHGVVTEVKKAGAVAGSAELALTLTSLDLGGHNYPLQSDQFKVKGPNKAGETVTNAVGAGIVGTIIGCAVGRGVGCAVGAGAGVAAGTAATAATPGPRAWIPAEALVTFHISSPLTVQPVGPQEAARLAQGLYPGGPTLYRRGYSPYGPGPYGRPYYGGYPPVYYRPYVVEGGYYYWR